MEFLNFVLQCRQYLTQEQLEKEIEPSIRYLLSQKYPSGNFRSSVGSNSDRLVHWCHGAPSMTMLFCLAYQVRFIASNQSNYTATKIYDPSNNDLKKYILQRRKFFFL